MIFLNWCKTFACVSRIFIFLRLTIGFHCGSTAVGPQDYENPKTSANRMHHKGRRTMDFCMFCVLSGISKTPRFKTIFVIIEQYHWDCWQWIMMTALCQQQTAAVCSDCSECVAVPALLMSRTTATAAAAANDWSSPQWKTWKLVYFQFFTLFWL
jgi:hypothetical protein